MDPATQLREWGYDVVQFTPWHFRVEGRLDFWLPRGKWYDFATHEKGQKPLDQIAFFFRARLGAPMTNSDEQSFVNALISAGWDEKEAREAWKERRSIQANS